MKAFNLPAGTRLKVTKVTPRKETHGKELVQAISLRVEWWPSDNEALNILHPQLQDMIFWTPPEIAAQIQLEGLPVVKKHLRVPTAQRPMKVDGSLSGYTITIDHGVDESSALELYGCEMDKFEADAKEGGSAIIRWSVASNKTITPELIGALCSLEGEEVTAQATPPAIQTGPTIDGTGAEFKKDHPEVDLFNPEPDPVARDAEQAFAEAVGGEVGEPERGPGWPFPVPAADEGEAGPGTGSSDDAGGEGGADSEGGETDVHSDVAAFEAGASKAIAAAGITPKGGRHGRAKLAAVE